MKRLLTAASGLVLLSTIPHLALADEADEHFKKGTELADKGQAPEAEEAFEKAWALRKAWDIAGNLGLMEAAQGKWEEAAEHMHYAVEHIGSLASPAHREGLEERYRNVIGRVAMVEVSTQPANAKLELSGRAAASSPPLFLMEGQYTLTVTADGYQTQELPLKVTTGEKRKLQVDLQKIPTAIKPPQEEKAIWPAVLLGSAGGAFLLGGIGAFVGGALVKSDADTVASEKTGCAASLADCADLDSSLSTANTLGALGFVGVGLGAAALAGLVIYLVVPQTPDAELTLRVRTVGTSVFLEGSF